MKQSILCVDDEVGNLDALERIFRSKYNVLRAESGPAALDILAKTASPIAVIISDQKMPEMTGVEFLEQSIKTHSDSIRILLTGYTDIESIIQAVNSGQIYRYLNKPWDSIDLMATVDRAVERYLLSQELKIKNQELAKAIGELKTLDEAKNRFMVLINHELKTPLTSIISFVDLLKETRLSEEQEICVKRIEKGSDRLRSMIEEVLLVVQGETGVLKAKISPFNCSDIQINVPAQASQLSNQKGLNTILRWLDKKIVGDKSLIEQIINRLLHNAAKFAKDNTQILVKVELSQPHRARFSVFNTGPAISDQIKDKIMKPFFLDEDMMNHSTGMGLGLTICQSILKAHSSKLEIKNEFDGVEVSFELPCL